MIVSVALLSCQFRTRFRQFSLPGTPDLATGSLRSLPMHCAVWTFLRDIKGLRLPSPREFGFQCAKGIIPQNNPRLGRGYFVIESKLILAADLKHPSSTDWALTFERRFTVLHCDFYCIWVITLCSAFYAIHRCHNFNSPPLETLSEFYELRVY